MRLFGSCAKLAVVICLVGASSLCAQDSRIEFFGDRVAMNLPHPAIDVPGFPRPMHVHQFNRVMIYFQDGGEALHYLDGKDVTHQGVGMRQVGFVFQHYALFRHMTVFENVAFGLRVQPRAIRHLAPAGGAL